MLDFITRWWEKPRRVARSNRRKRILHAIRLVKTGANRGLIKRAIFNLPYTSYVRITEALYDDIYIRMNDGFEVSGYNISFTKSASRALSQYAWRMRERGLI